MEAAVEAVVKGAGGVVAVEGEKPGMVEAEVGTFAYHHGLHAARAFPQLLYMLLQPRVCEDKGAPEGISAT